MSQVHKDFHKITQIDPLRRRVRELVKDLRNAKKEGKQPLYLDLVKQELHLCFRRYKQALRNPSGIPESGIVESVTEY
jgi:hypothetical protein